MANAWFRLYTEFANDPKVQSMPEIMQRRLIMIFCLRGSNSLVTLHETDIAFALRITHDELAATKKLFIQKGFIDQEWNITNWERRQFASDSSAARVRAYRERKKNFNLNTCNVTGNNSVTNDNAPDSDTDSDSDTEYKEKINKKKIENPDGGDQEPEPSKPKKAKSKAKGATDTEENQEVFKKLWKQYPKKSGPHAAYRAFLKLNANAGLIAEITNAIERQKLERELKKKHNIWFPSWKDFSTWLNKKCWMEEVNLSEVDLRAEAKSNGAAYSNGKNYDGVAI